MSENWKDRDKRHHTYVAEASARSLVVGVDNKSVLEKYHTTCECTDDGQRMVDVYAMPISAHYADGLPKFQMRTVCVLCCTLGNKSVPWDLVGKDVVIDRIKRAIIKSQVC